MVMYYGSVLMNLEKNSEALECFRFSNIIYQSKYGPDHLTVSENLHLTGFVLEKLSESADADRNNLDEALDLLTEALRIRKLHLVDTHPELEETLLCLGKVHNKLGNTKDALVFMTAAVKARDVRLGRGTHARLDDAEALLQVGHLQQQSGEFQQASRSFEDCLEIKLQILGEVHPSIGELMFFIGNLHRIAGDLELSRTKFKEALAILEQTGSDIIEIADVHFSIGVLYTEQEQHGKALDAFLQALQLRRSTCSSTKAAVAEVQNNIGISYYGLKEYDKSRMYHTEALESLIEELGDDHPDVAFCWHSLGTVHVELHDQAEALSCFKNAVRIERSEENLQSLGICLVQMNDHENAYVCLSGKCIVTWHMQVMQLVVFNSSSLGTSSPILFVQRLCV